MKKWIPVYGAYFLGVGSVAVLGYLWWRKYGEEILPEGDTEVTVVTGNGEGSNGHHATVMSRPRRQE